MKKDLKTQITKLEMRIFCNFLFILFSCAALLILLPHIFEKSYADDTLQKVKKPVFAGSFYPAERNQLEKRLDIYLKAASTQTKRTSSHIFGLISPHAGYDYSGQVAAYAYNQIKDRDYKTVIIIGPSHQVPFRGISIYPVGSWETPLGTVQVDIKTAKTLMDNCNAIKVYPAAFAREHSLEVQLPFLQKTLKSFKIVPLAVGFIEKDDYKRLSDALLRLLEQNPKDILFVASSDMSHYHSYNKASQMDRVTLKYIEHLDVDRLFENLQNGNCELCGAPGVITLMMMASKLNAHVKTLNYANSGDVTGDKNRVVGYGATAFMYADKNDNELSLKEQKTLLTIARKTLEEFISNGNIPKLDIKEGQLLEKRGVFVTLKKHDELRGCIGYIMPIEPLYKAVIEMTISSSTKDPRFLPVSKKELKDISIEISALTPLIPVENPNQIEVGKHGLYITRGGRSGLLLPQVATENKWNRDEFLSQTCRKAGLPQNAWNEKGTKTYTFTAQIFSE